MALYNLARVTTATTGTGTITLGSAVDGFRTFAQAGVTNGATVTYSIRDGSQSEIGRGVYTLSGTTLTRSVLISTNSNAAINLSGSAEVMITAAAEDFTDAKARANHTGTQLAATISDLGTAAISIVTSRAALKALDTSVIRTVHLRLGIQSGTFQWWAGDYSAIIALDTVGGYAMKADAVADTAGAWLRVIDGDTINALWFGVDSSGVSATHGAVQVAINVAAEAGYKCYFPRGLYRLTSALTHPEASHIIGDGKAAGIFSLDYTYFWADHSGDCFGNTNNYGSRSLRGVNFYRTQPTPGGGTYTPNTYGWEYNIVGGQDIYFDDIHLHNVSKAIKAVGDPATSAACGRIHLNRITGQPLVEGFNFTHCSDVVWGDEIEWWVFFSNATTVLTAMRSAAIGMTLGRLDNAKFGKLFFYSYARSVMLNNQGASASLPTGTVARLHVDVLGADNTGIALLINSGCDGASLHFNHLYAGCNLASPSVTTESFVWTLGDNAIITVGNLYGQYNVASLVALNGTGNRVVATTSKSLGIDYSSLSVPEFNPATGNTITLLSSPITSATVKYPSIAGTGIIETPDWRSYTPTVTANAGLFTTVSATGKFRRLPGKSVLFQFHVTTTTVGTASGFTNVTLPYTCGSSWHFGSSREIASTGLMCTATVAPAATVLNIVTYNNVFATGSGTQVVGQVEYEAA